LLYKQVAVAARDLLAIPAAEVDVERLFSQGRDVLGIRRMGLDSETMRMIMLLKAHFDQMDKKRAEITEKKQALHQSVYG
jgi:hAT family C-terminal dimerisation region